MAGGLDKAFKFGIGHTCRPDQERLHPDPPDRPFAIIGKLGAVGADIGPAARHLHGVIRHLPGSGHRRRHGYACLGVMRVGSGTAPGIIITLAHV